MINLRQRIERQVFRLNGLALNEFDLSQPAGDPGLYGPDSVIWRVHGDFSSMMCGGISALLLQMLHPAALAGVWEHSSFRQDMLGRLRRTSQFIAVTTFGNRQDAQILIDRVTRIHLKVNGVDSVGNPYAASDPHLLTWVHVAETSRFLAAHLRYKNPYLSPTEQDRYYQEAAIVAEALGAQHIPKSVAAVEDYFRQMQGELRFDQRTAEVTNTLMNAPAPSWQAKPVMKLMLKAGIGLMPEWAQTMSGYRIGRWQQRVLDQQIRLISASLRWSIQRGAYHRAMVRMGRDPE